MKKDFISKSRASNHRKIFLGSLALFFCLFILSPDSLARVSRFKPPQIISVSPGHLSTLRGGDALNVNIQAKDPNGGRRLLYRFFWDGKLINNWSQASKFAKKTSNSDTGRHRIRLDVINDKGMVSSKSVDIYIYYNMPNPFK